MVRVHISPRLVPAGAALALAGAYVLAAGTAAQAQSQAPRAVCTVNGVVTTSTVIKGTTGADVIECTNSVPAGVMINGLAGVDLINVAGGNAGIIDGGSADDLIHVTGGNSGAINGSAGADIINLDVTGGPIAKVGPVVGRADAGAGIFLGGDDTASIGVPSVSVGVPSVSVGVPSASVGVPSASVSVPSASVGVPSASVPSASVGVLNAKPGISIGVPHVGLGLGLGITNTGTVHGDSGLDFCFVTSAASATADCETVM